MQLEKYYDQLKPSARTALAQTLWPEARQPRAMLFMVARGKRPMPAGLCIALEHATRGAVTRYEIRPDVFGRKPKKQTGKRGETHTGAGA